MLRLPLPANIDLASSAFIESHAILRGTRYLYLNLSDRNRHNLGARVPVGAFVLLERQDGAAPDIEVVSAAEILRQSIWQNFAREVDAPRILGGLSQVVSQARCMRLTYDRADEAIELLGERFGEWDQDSNQAVDPIPRLVPTVIPDSKSGDNRFVQAENVQVISVDKEKFLASPDGHAIHHLNPVASAIWGLLAAPNSIEDVASLLVAAFPETELKTIQKDVSSLMKTLISKNLVSLQK